MYSKKAPLYGMKYCPPCDLTAVSGGKYVGAPGSGCGANHVILLANGSPQGDGEAFTLLKADGGNTNQISYSQSYITKSDQDDFTDEFSRFLRNVDVSSANPGTQYITTHGIAVIGGTSDGLYPNFIKAIATQGGGQYYGAGERQRRLNNEQASALRAHGRLLVVRSGCWKRRGRAALGG